jgi:hypothetical protein
MNFYSFINPIKGTLETEDGVISTEGYSNAELEAKVEALIDPTLDQKPQPGDPVSIYPASCGDDPILKRRWEENYLAVQIELPPLRLLPEGSLLRAEWFRRAAILKRERELRQPAPPKEISPEQQARQDEEMLLRLEQIEKLLKQDIPATEELKAKHQAQIEKMRLEIQARREQGRQEQGRQEQGRQEQGRQEQGRQEQGRQEQGRQEQGDSF